MSVITSCHFNRPEYSARHAQALSRCRGIERYTVLAVIEPSEDAERIASLIKMIPAAKVEAIINPKRLGVELNPRKALRQGFALSDYVIHVEDDILLSADALEFFEHCQDAYREDKQVFSVGAHNRDYQLHH